MTPPDTAHFFAFLAVLAAVSLSSQVLAGTWMKRKTSGEEEEEVETNDGA
jgi:hypothetical protein